MANTNSQIYLQFVFAVRNREALISKQHKDELHRYITGLVQNRGAKMLAVHCMPDHMHLFVGFRPVMSISDFVKEVKVESNQFINAKGWIKGSFKWQEGFGVCFRIHIRTSAGWLTTSKIRKIIMHKIRSERNI